MNFNSLPDHIRAEIITLLEQNMFPEAKKLYDVEIKQMTR